jgi:hypothetical protein
MTTIRRRLTFWYTVALTVTVVGFGTLLYLERRQSSLRELDQRLLLEADLADRWLTESYNVLGRIVTTAGARPALDPGISAYLEAIRDYLIVVDTTGGVLTLSEVGRELSAADIQRLTSVLDSLRLPKVSGTLDLSAPVGKVRYLAVRMEGGGPEVAGVLVATSVSRVAFGPAALLRSMLLIAPVILIGAIVVGHWLAGTSLRPVQGIMDEVEAISDGRSLHRRLPVPMSGDEMARLALTVNGMLSRLEQSFASLHRFTADASHELKTPLMVLRAGVERALVHPGVPPEILQSLDETLAQINQMSEMVENLLTLARSGRGPRAAGRGGVGPAGAAGGRRRDRGDAGRERGHRGPGRHPRAPGAAGGGPPPDPGDAAQPGDQRHQVHPAGRHRRPRTGRRGRSGGHHRAGQRHRHRPGRPAPHLRAVLAGRPGPLPHGGPARDGPGARDHQVDRGGAWGNHHGAEPTGAGHGVRGTPPQDPGRRAGTGRRVMRITSGCGGERGPEALIRLSWNCHVRAKATLSGE